MSGGVCAEAEREESDRRCRRVHEPGVAVDRVTVPEREVHMAIRGDYFPYRIPEDKLSVLPYPPPDLR